LIAWFYSLPISKKMFCSPTDSIFHFTIILNDNQGSIYCHVSAKHTKIYFFRTVDTSLIMKVINHCRQLLQCITITYISILLFFCYTSILRSLSCDTLYVIVYFFSLSLVDPCILFLLYLFSFIYIPWLSKNKVRERRTR
jgi:hypothetical protein